MMYKPEDDGYGLSLTDEIKKYRTIDEKCKKLEDDLSIMFATQKALYEEVIRLKTLVDRMVEDGI